MEHEQTIEKSEVAKKKPETDLLTNHKLCKFLQKVDIGKKS